MRPSRDADPTHADYLRDRPARFEGYERTSRYLTMRDGTRIAIDVSLPRGLGSGERIPTIMRQTRYFRRFRVAAPLRRVLGETTLDPMNWPMRRSFTARGYAWVDVDARGSGASFGERPCPWWLEGEVADGAQIAEWITKQPWSNGRVGSTGVSYDGTTAEFLATTRHPAVRAIAPRFSLFDVYTDVAFPGGLHNAYFTEAWEHANEALDRNKPGEMVALIYALQAHGMPDPRAAVPGTWHNRVARFVDHPRTQALMRAVLTRGLGGVAPTDEDGDRALLAAALRSHANNYNVHHGAVHMTFRDDSPPTSPVPGQTPEYFSPHTYASQIVDAGVAVLGYGGWFDGAYANAAFKRHHALSRGGQSSILMGPWVHGGQLDLDPRAPGPRAVFDHATELLRFFDAHLIPERASSASSATIRYFALGEGRWRSARTWPPEGARGRVLHLGRGRRLSREASESAVDVHRVDPTTRAGKRTRWRTLLCPFLHADGMGRSPSGWLVYESDPFDDSWSLVGNPVLELAVSMNVPDAAIVAYLDLVDASGQARVFTEGELRTVHRTRMSVDESGIARVHATFGRADELRLEEGARATHAIELLPTAMRIERGQKLRLVLGGADLDHFTTPASDKPVEWRVHLEASRLHLPALEV